MDEFFDILNNCCLSNRVSTVLLLKIIIIFEESYIPIHYKKLPKLKFLTHYKASLKNISHCIVLFLWDKRSIYTNSAQSNSRYSYFGILNVWMIIVQVGDVKMCNKLAISTHNFYGEINGMSALKKTIIVFNLILFKF